MRVWGTDDVLSYHETRYEIISFEASEMKNTVAGGQ